jgi:hypothetical protein
MAGARIGGCARWKCEIFEIFEIFDLQSGWELVYPTS